MPRLTRLTWWSMACAAFVHLLYLTTPLHVDEAGVAMVGRSAIAAGDSSLYGQLFIDRPPPLVLLFGYADAAAGAVGVRLIGLAAAISLVAACAWTTRRIVGPRYEAYAAVIAAMLASAPALSAHITYAELIGAPFVCASVGCIAPVIARERNRAMQQSEGAIPALASPAAAASLQRVRASAHLWILAGVLAACALLIKQSFIDGIAAGAALAFASPGIRTALIRGALFSLGAVIPIGMTVVWASERVDGIAQLAYATIGFRFDAEHALAAAHGPVMHRLFMLVAGMSASGYFVLLPFAVYGLRTAWRTSRAVSVCMAIWLGAGWVGVMGGGYFWTHYMIAVAPVMVVMSMYGLEGIRCARSAPTSRLLRAPIAVVAACLIVHVTSTVVSARQTGPTSQRTAQSAAQVVTDNRRTGDSIFVLYARANLVYYAHVRPAFPYQWSLMYRTVPSIEHRVLALLNGADAPDWIVAWNSPSSFGMDHDGRIQQALSTRYREVATPCGIPVLLRRTDHRPIHIRDAAVCS